MIVSASPAGRDPHHGAAAGGQEAEPAREPLLVLADHRHRRLPVERDRDGVVVGPGPTPDRVLPRRVTSTAAVIVGASREGWRLC